MCPACCFKWHASSRRKASGVLGSPYGHITGTRASPKMNRTGRNGWRKGIWRQMPFHPPRIHHFKWLLYWGTPDRYCIRYIHLKTALLPKHQPATIQNKRTKTIYIAETIVKPAVSHKGRHFLFIDMTSNEITSTVFTYWEQNKFRDAILLILSAVCVKLYYLRAVLWSNLWDKTCWKCFRTVLCRKCGNFQRRGQRTALILA